MGYQWSLADRPIGDEFRAIAREQIDKALATANNRNATPSSRVHEARRRCKKLRALFRLVRSGFADYAVANAAVRDAARALSGARDTHVLRQTLSDLLEWGGGHALVPEPVSSGSDEERAALAGFAVRLTALRDECIGWDCSRITLGTLVTGLSATYRKGRHAARAALTSLDDEQFHEWRKEAKYFGNQLRLLERAAPDMLAPAARLTGELGDLLGLHHDLSLLGEALNQGEFAEVVAEAEHLPALQARRRQEIENRIAVLGRQLYAETPGAVERRFSTYLALRPAPGDAA
jgi:CHAD domain-containing protein